MIWNLYCIKYYDFRYIHNEKQVCINIQYKIDPPFKWQLQVTPLFYVDYSSNIYTF